MMDYEGIVRGADRRANLRPQMGAMSVVAPVAPAGGHHQPQQQQQAAQPRPEPARQMLGGACYPTPMGM